MSGGFLCSAFSKSDILKIGIQEGDDLITHVIHLLNAVLKEIVMHDVPYRKSEKDRCQEHSGQDEFGREHEQRPYRKQKEKRKGKRHHQVDQSFMLKIRYLDLKLREHAAGLIFTGLFHVIVNKRLHGLHRLNDVFLHKENLLFM